MKKVRLFGLVSATSCLWQSLFHLTPFRSNIGGKVPVVLSFTPVWLAPPPSYAHPTPSFDPPNAAANLPLYRSGRKFVKLQCDYVYLSALSLAINGPSGMQWLATRCVAAMPSPYAPLSTIALPLASGRFR